MAFRSHLWKLGNWGPKDRCPKAKPSAVPGAELAALRKAKSVRPQGLPSEAERPLPRAAFPAAGAASAPGKGAWEPVTEKSQSCPHTLPSLKCQEARGR